MTNQEIIKLFILCTHKLAITIGSTVLKSYMKFKYSWTNEEYDSYYKIYTNYLNTLELNNNEIVISQNKEIFTREEFKIGITEALTKAAGWDKNIADSYFEQKF